MLEASPGRVRNRGLGLDACAAGAVLTGPSYPGALRPLELVIGAATGLAVLDADDPGCLALAAAAQSRVCLVTTDADNPELVEHAAGGGVVVRHRASGPITLLDGGDFVARFDHPPTRWAGFAVALAHGLGVDARHIDQALRG